ncbi:hypothetical protein CSW59_01250 [Caulobacter sp. BP25]|nr:hypothetical protein CSW59_01250 [Caulobacter sp. BP25]
MTLAALAVALKVMIPAGFMTAPDSRNGLPFALVLCTGDGAKLVQPGEALAGHQDKSGGADNSAHDTPCPFAGHGAGAPPPSAVTVAKVAFVAYAPIAPSRVTHLAPGRGLAAPPLPARGPPSQLI